MSANPLVSFFLGWATIGLLMALDHLLFSVVADRNYFLWCLNNGSVIALVTGFVVLVLDLDSAEKKAWAFLSTDPTRYLIACSQVGSQTILSWAPVFSPPNARTKRELESLPNNRARAVYRLTFFWDVWFSVVLSIVALLAFVTWFLVVVPVQYLAFLVCGAPARMALRSSRHTYLGVDVSPTGRVSMDIVDAPESLPPPQEAIPFGPAVKPVAFTSFIVSGFLQVGSLFATSS